MWLPVTGALFGGVLTGSAILKRNLMGTIAKQGNSGKGKTEQRPRNAECRGQAPEEQTQIGKMAQ